MATIGRPWTEPNGQLVDELRRRDQSGIPDRHLSHLRQMFHRIGPPCWIAHDTSAALHVFDEFELAPPFHFMVPRGRVVHRSGHVVHTSDSIPSLDCETRFGLPVLSPTRTLIHIASTTDPVRLTAALDGALRDGLTTEDFLHRRIAQLRSKGRHGVPRLIAVMDGSEITRGGQSWLEREVLRILAAADLPRPVTQAHLARRGDKLVRVDFHFAETPIVVEALGYRWHRTGAQLRVDSERLNQLQLAGYIVLQFTYEQIVDDPEQVVAVIRAALDRWFVNSVYAS